MSPDMSQDNKESTLAQLKLGESQLYVDQYDAGLLQAIPRALSRQHLSLPSAMYGTDIWTGYELSWLNSSGKPVIALAIFEIPADSTHIVESKSFKYYLNSLNQTSFASRDSVVMTLKQDLSLVVGVPVKVTLFAPEAFDVLRKKAVSIGEGIDDCALVQPAYQPDKNVLLPAEASDSICYYSHLLKSNCPVTGQPDWATVWVGMEGTAVTRESLLAYIVSFRQHQDFHENCVERMFSDIFAAANPTQLWVYARYTRRGGLDINPFRSLKPMSIPAMFAARQ